jgi:hypothetical protein
MDKTRLLSVTILGIVFSLICFSMDFVVLGITTLIGVVVAITGLLSKD